MFNAIGHIKGQDDRANADFGNSQQIFPSQHIRIKPVVQPRVRISPALFDPLWRAEHLTESVQVGPDFWILGQDMSSTVFIEMEAMPEHIFEDHHHMLHISHQRATRKLGAAAYLPKPFERGELLQAVRETLQDTMKKSKANR